MCQLPICLKRQFTNCGIWLTSTLVQFTPADAEKRKLLLLAQCFVNIAIAVRGLKLYRRHLWTWVEHNRWVTHKLGSLRQTPNSHGGKPFGCGRTADSRLHTVKDAFANLQWESVEKRGVKIQGSAHLRRTAARCHWHIAKVKYCHVPVTSYDTASEMSSSLPPPADAVLFCRSNQNPTRTVTNIRSVYQILPCLLAGPRVLDRLVSKHPHQYQTLAFLAWKKLKHRYRPC